eukprot:1662710-Alexandrium_andersonii.AAC.1
MKLPCDPERRDSVPAPGKPRRATVLVTIAGPQGQGPESLHGGWKWAAHGGPHRWPQGRALGSVH